MSTWAELFNISEIHMLLFFISILLIVISVFLNEIRKSLNNIGLWLPRAERIKEQ